MPGIFKQEFLAGYFGGLEKTLTEEEVALAVKLTFSGQLCQKSGEEGTKFVNQYQKYQKKEKQSSTFRTCLIIDLRKAFSLA